ncbi:uncharacterized protein LOC130828654 [Amaranthus tricolor]|uniref:uncharacterized protein LOC130828654 n=1 Tax=Amaranthus tricolor TaxID=29722 RepID=UPI0025852ACB|nr:uncharacterized protein LOC130828654 [Amaranthus tricolor]
MEVGYKNLYQSLASSQARLRWKRCSHTYWGMKGSLSPSRCLKLTQKLLILSHSLCRRIRAQPEGSIAEGYILEETITFCSRYLEGVETLFNRPRRNDDDNENGSSYLFNACGRPIGEVKVINLNHKSKMQIHRYVLTQFQKVLQPFEREFLSQK